MGGVQDVNMNKPDYAGFLPINAASLTIYSTGHLFVYAWMSVLLTGALILF